jgi:hypothetical protein
MALTLSEMNSLGGCFVGLFVIGLAMPGCGAEANNRATSAYRCVDQYNACICGDPAHVALLGTETSSCPGAVPQGPSRCCKGTEGCRCVPYACQGGVTSTCSCQYTVNPVKPSRCLTDAQKVDEQSSDPAAGDHCCASLAADAGQCRCTTAECASSEKEVSLCSVDTANSACPAGETEVTTCTP